MSIAKAAASSMLLAALACSGPVAASDVPPPPAVAAGGEMHVRGALLAIDARYVVFTSGDAIRLRAGTAIPTGATLGSLVLVTIDRLGRDIDAIVLEGHAPDEIPIASVPRVYIVATEKSARADTPPAVSVAAPVGTAAGANPSGPSPVDAAITSATLEVTVPTTTSPSDDVYVSTDRSNYSPSEIRMTRVASRTFVATVALDANGKLKYQYTRGTYATVERDRAGGIVRPHVVERPAAKIEDTVTRWADSN